MYYYFFVLINEGQFKIYIVTLKRFLPLLD